MRSKTRSWFWSAASTVAASTVHPPGLRRSGAPNVTVPSDVLPTKTGRLAQASSDPAPPEQLTWLAGSWMPRAAVGTRLASQVWNGWLPMISRAWVGDGAASWNLAASLAVAGCWPSPSETVTGPTVPDSVPLTLAPSCIEKAEVSTANTAGDPETVGGLPL